MKQTDGEVPSVATNICFSGLFSVSPVFQMLVSLAWMLTGCLENVQYMFSLCRDSTSECLA